MKICINSAVLTNYTPEAREMQYLFRLFHAFPRAEDFPGASLTRIFGKCFRLRVRSHCPGSISYAYFGEKFHFARSVALTRKYILREFWRKASFCAYGCTDPEAFLTRVLMKSFVLRVRSHCPGSFTYAHFGRKLLYARKAPDIERDSEHKTRPLPRIFSLPAS